MTPELRADLWTALFEKFDTDMPGVIREMMEDAGIAALRHQEARSPLYTFGMPEPRHTPPPRSRSPVEDADADAPIDVSVLSEFAPGKPKTLYC